MRTKILVVDDDEDILDSLSSALEGHYEVLSARNGVEALGVVAAADVVLLDLMMPVMNGEEFLGELAARGLDVPVILSSASPQLGAKALSLGARAHLRKPYSLAQLESSIQAALKG